MTVYANPLLQLAPRTFSPLCAQLLIQARSICFSRFVGWLDRRKLIQLLICLITIARHARPDEHAADPETALNLHTPRLDHRHSG